MLRLRDVLILATTLMFTACDILEKADEDEDEEDTTGLPGLEDSTDTIGGGAEYGPENSWWHAMESDVPADLEGTGYGEGDIAYNFQLNDQFGDEVELYQFYGQVVVLDVYAEW